MSINNDKYILDGHTPVPCDDLMAWALWFEEPNNRHVRYTEVGPLTVSTIFLGLDHNFGNRSPLLGEPGPPILFETMVWAPDHHEVEAFGRKITFDRSFLDIQERCSTWEEAQAQHQRIVDQVREPGDKVEEITPVFARTNEPPGRA